MSLDVLKVKARAVACRLAAWAMRTVTEAMRPLPLVSGLIEDALRSREELLAENLLLLRQRLVVGFSLGQTAQVSSSGEGPVRALGPQAAALARGDCACAGDCSPLTS